MIAPCTKLDQTVNQMRLLFAIGSREAIIKNTPSVAYTPKIISRYSARPPACHAQPDCQTIVSGHMPKVNINPTINKAIRRYLMRSDSVICSPFFGDSVRLVHFSDALRDHSMKEESQKSVLAGTTT